MKKIYVRFGEITDPTHTEVYEAIMEKKTVKVLMPKTSHPAAIDFARSVGFGDTPTFVVDGRFEGTDDKSISILSNCTIIKELTYDSQTETYIWVDEVKIEKTQEEKLYNRLGWWRYTKALMSAGIPFFLLPKAWR